MGDKVVRFREEVGKGANGENELLLHPSNECLLTDFIINHFGRLDFFQCIELIIS